MRRAAAFLALGLLAGACDTGGPAPVAGPAPPSAPAGEPRMALERTAFDALPGWTEDGHAAALATFLRSCEKIVPQPEGRVLDGLAPFGRIADWKPVCAAARAVRSGDNGAARAFFESRFTPWTASDRGVREGLFTGYYEAEIRGAKARSDRYRVPVLRRPPDLVTVELGGFRDSLKGERIAGRLDGGRLVPYADRAAIMRGALDGRGLEILWTDDPVALFFLHVQGSGRAVMEDGRRLRLGYDATNGHPYVSVGKVLIDRGAIDREAMSMDAIRAWLAAHPGEVDALLGANPSYVFLKVQDGDGPVGAQGVVLTPGRSLAVDRRFMALGPPVWLETRDPVAERPLRRLMVAQDTGGAIRGPVRGDVFFGHGAEAERAAGHMRRPGTCAVLLPAGLDPNRP